MRRDQASMGRHGTHSIMDTVSPGDDSADTDEDAGTCLALLISNAVTSMRVPQRILGAHMPASWSVRSNEFC